MALGVKAMRRFARFHDIMDELPVKPGLDIGALELNANVIPTAGVYAGALSVNGAIQFQRVLGVAPAAEIPPGTVFVVIVVE